MNSKYRKKNSLSSLLCIHDNENMSIHNIKFLFSYTQTKMSLYQQNDDDDYEAITRIFDTNSLLQCPLCKKDFQDPRILCSNGHTFCSNCIQVY